MQEPRDGDFVAYIDALQRESAARLLSRQHANAADEAFAAKVTPAVRGAEIPSAPGSGAGSIAAGRRGPGGIDPALFKAVVAGLIGGLFLLSWLTGSGTASFVLAAVLLFYALPRLHRAYREHPRLPQGTARLEDAFGRSGTSTTGKKR